MPKITNYLGHRIGRLVVVEELSPGRWRCQCDCGNEICIIGGWLKDGHTKSCGCLQSCPIRLKEVGILRYIKLYLEASKWEVNLSRERVEELIFSNCYYCGAPPSNEMIPRGKGSGGSLYFLYNGIDRVDPLKGYEEGNVVTACKICNIAKLNFTKKDWLEWLKIITKKIQRLQDLSLVSSPYSDSLTGTTIKRAGDLDTM